ncbi:hypothetical protein GLP59_17165 [Sulfitobacter sp. M220]|nr:hypothetical protein [Sulfitobacter sp. M220]MCF7779339.1 hypothetical protein [Sulfitobacter sp. M220]
MVGIVSSETDVGALAANGSFVRIAAIERLDDYVVAANVRFDGCTAA